jgi:hypothetical protein
MPLEKKPESASVMHRQSAARRCAMAKGQMKSNKETRKPKKDKAKPAAGGTSSFTTQMKSATDANAPKGKK